MPERVASRAVAVPPIDPDAIPGWTAAPILPANGCCSGQEQCVAPSRGAAGFPLDYDVRLILRMDCSEFDAVERRAASRFAAFEIALAAPGGHILIRARQFDRNAAGQGEFERDVRLLIDAHCFALDAEAGLCRKFHEFAEALRGRYPGAELLCRRYDKIRFDDPDWLRW